jgi:hypothetical protein
MKISDKMLCINNSDTISFKDEYSKNKTYEVFISDYDSNHLCIKSDIDGRKICPNWDNFVNINEMRKLKLEKISKCQIGSK